MKISEISNWLKGLTIEELPPALISLGNDERTGVIKLVKQYEKKIEAYEKAASEWCLKCEFDAVFHENAHLLVGIDEVGRGPLAGPVVAAAVILPYETSLLGLRDSKKLSEEKREALYDEIMNVATAVGIGIVDANEIDEINILQATFKAMKQALEALDQEYTKLLVDGDKEIPNIEVEQHAIIGGDDKSASIAAASVIAKVTRDRMMKKYAQVHPEYDWESNKGYGSQKHYDGIKAYGITSLHRKSFLKNIEI